MVQPGRDPGELLRDRRNRRVGLGRHRGADRQAKQRRTQDDVE